MISICDELRKHMVELTGARNVQSLDTSLHLILGLVLVRIGQIRHLLEWHNLNTKLVPVLLDRILRIVRAVKVDALGVLSRTSVITAHNEVGSTVILADDSVPDGLAGTAHAHGKGQETQHGHAIGVARQQRLVYADAGEVVDVAGLGQADNRVDQHVGLTGAGGADGELSVGAVHGVARLEGDDLGPAKLVEVETELSGCV